MTDPPVFQPQPWNRHVLVGLAIMLVGLAALASQIQGRELYSWTSWWPLLLLLMGLVRIVDPPVRDGCRMSRRSGLWLFSIGIWGWVSEARLLGLTYATSWPLLVIAAGANTVWRSLEQPERPPRTAGGVR